MKLTFSTEKLNIFVVIVKFINENTPCYFTENQSFLQLNKMIKNRMKTKNLMVSFVVIAMALFLVATVSAAYTVSGDSDVTIDEITIDGVSLDGNSSSVAVIAGETIVVKVYFTANENASDVTIKAELDDSTAKTEKFDIEDGESYKKVLTLKVPYNFDDEDLSDSLNFDITVKGENDNDDDFEVEVESELTVQRASYNVDFKSISVDQKVEAGEIIPVEIVLKNNGYNDLDDLYITAKISALGVEKSVYFGDLVDSAYADSDDADDEDTDTLSKVIELTIPYGTEAGEYVVEVEASNDDVTLSKAATVEVSNSFPDTVIKSGDSLIIVNPTDSMVGYRIVTESPATVSESLVFVQAGSTETVTVTSNAEGEYSFDVAILSMSGDVVKTVTFSGEAEANQIASPIVILTVVLAIVFLVLLVVLIVLVTKKPEKSEEFGESYY